MDDKIDKIEKELKELAEKVYGNYNALGINMDVKQPILDDYVDCLKPDVKRFFVIDYLDCLKPDKTL